MATESVLWGVRLLGKPADTFWNVTWTESTINSIEPHKQTARRPKDGRLLGPSLCHPHIHLDKCFLLSHPKYSDLTPTNGDFAEALKLTSMWLPIPTLSLHARSGFIFLQLLISSKIMLSLMPLPRVGASVEFFWHKCTASHVFEHTRVLTSSSL
jgi:hypothetical protein